ncbi:MAG: ABC transporter ATP-binding protein [Pseudomonadota bacterium]|nr:MAG: ABC transporter ATP-binding protein [Pseudomonadota bacterium]
MSMIRLRGVHKTFLEGNRRHVVLDGTNLEIEAGQTVALLGRSGSGKSTLLNMVSGIDVPDAGEVIVCNENIACLGESARTLFRRHHVGFVFQFFNLIPTLTVLENLLLPVELAGKLNNVARERAADLLARVGLADRAASYPEQLSGGEQQRVAVARAVIHRPSVLLADEPTGNLDEAASSAVLDLFAELVSASDVTLLMVTHSREIAGRCSRVLELRDGVAHELQVQGT